MKRSPFGKFAIGHLALAASLPAVLLTAPLLSGPADAAPAAYAPRLEATTDTDTAVRDYWTPERIQGARNLDLKVTGVLRHGPPHALSRGARQVVPGGLPTVGYDPDEAVTLPAMSHTETQPGVRPNLTGSSGLPFTTNRLYPAKDVYKSFPYGAVGHLFFTTPQGNFQCSASVIRSSVIATAGHCVADGAGNYYSNWLFIPAQNGSLEPYGSWTWASASTTSAWWGGGGTVPNEQDDAVIVLAQKKYHGALHNIGDITGYFGYEYNAGAPNALSQLGYPCNLDSCSDPVATYTQAAQGPNNNYVWGTASFGGASGGPEVQDFGIAPSGTPAETLGGNIVVSSTSFTYTASGVDEDGGSAFYAPGQNGEYTFGDLINWACSTAGHC